MKKASKLIYAAAGILTLAAIAVGIFSIHKHATDNPQREINGFVLGEDDVRNIDLSQITAEGSGRDGVPALNQPKFVPIASAQTTDQTPGILVENGGEKHFYPHNIIAWHQVVNDYVGSTPIAVFYSPQCGTAAAYKRLANDQSIWLGVSGLTYHGGTLLYDDATDSLWLENTGQAVAGPRIGVQMERVATQILTWKQAKKDHPSALALSAETGFERDYQGAYPGKKSATSTQDECHQDMLQ